MSYVVLARKYRPQSFAEVVGQDPVSQTLLNALESGRVAHAYVFSGPRGVGKTTTARILAKCLNCTKGPTIKPCNECPSCLTIAQGSSVDDVLEIDGASNRGIEQIRELRESAKYAPTASRYRIFIIDEAHQITKDAFGALLKILEEPPAHVVFMMATTEVQKIPAPILSRCQRFSLRPISAEAVFAHLKSICKTEKIKVEDEALADIVRFVEGSLRDALSLLDQAIVFAPDKISSGTLKDLLGLLPAEVVRTFARTMLDGKPDAILLAVDDLLKNGIDLTQLAKDLQAYYHDLLLVKAGVRDPLAAPKKETVEQAEAFDFATLERNIRLLSRAMEEMRRSETPRAVFDIYALRIGQKAVDPREWIERLERLEKSGPAPASPVIVPAAAPKPMFQSAPPPPPATKPSFQTPPSSSSSATAVAAPVKPVAVKSAPAGDASTATQVVEKWDDFVRALTQQKQSLGSSLLETQAAVENGAVKIILSNTFQQQMLQRNSELLKSVAAELTGAAPSFTFAVEAASPSSKPSPASSASTPTAPRSAAIEEAEEKFESLAPEKVGNDIQKALKHFPGTIKREKKS